MEHLIPPRVTKPWRRGKEPADGGDASSEGGKGDFTGRAAGGSSPSPPTTSPSRRSLPDLPRDPARRRYPAWPPAQQGHHGARRLAADLVRLARRAAAGSCDTAADHVEQKRRGRGRSSADGAASVWPLEDARLTRGRSRPASPCRLASPPIPSWLAGTVWCGLHIGS